MPAVLSIKQRDHVAEIVAQVDARAMYVRQKLSPGDRIRHHHRYRGLGNHSDNYDNVIRSLESGQL